MSQSKCPFAQAVDGLVLSLQVFRHVREQVPLPVRPRGAQPEQSVKRPLHHAAVRLYGYPTGVDGIGAAAAQCSLRHVAPL